MFETPESGQTQGEGGDAEGDLATAETKAHDGGEPECGGGGDAEDKGAFAEDGAGADEPHAGEDAEGEAHEVENDEGVGGFADRIHEEVGLDHGDGGGEADEESGSHAGGATVLSAVEADDKPGDDREKQSEGDLLPGKGYGHRAGSNISASCAGGRAGNSQLFGDVEGYYDSSMFGKSYRLPGTLLGIPVYVDLSFILILPLLAWIIGSQVGYFAKMFGISMDASLTSGAMPYVLGLVAALGLFVSVVVHELGHAVTARGYDVKVTRITLWFLGGVAQFEEMPKQRGAEAVVAIVGPMVSLAIAVVCWGILRATAGAGAGVHFVLAYLVYMNVVLAIFNLIPALPLDGGRVLRSVLALGMPQARATEITAGISKFLAILMGVFGLFSLNFFLLLVAIFIYMAVSAETRTGQLEDLLRGALVKDLMNPDVHTVPPDLNVSELEQRMFREHHLGFPVIDAGGNLLGMVTLHDVEGRDPTTLVREVMTPDPPTLPEKATAVEALHLMSRNGFGKVIATREGGRMSGIITKKDLMRLIQLRLAGWGISQPPAYAGADRL